MTRQSTYTKAGHQKATRNAGLRSLLGPGLLAAGLMGPAAPALAQASDPFIGQMALFGSNFCPRGWVDANGQLLPISSYSALFSIMGTIYGGDGRTTFGMPDLRGRETIGVGQGSGLSNVALGQKGGSEIVTLTTSHLPPHSHMVNAVNQTGNKLGPGGDYLTDPPPIDGEEVHIYHDGPPNKQMDPGMLSSTGLGQPVNIRTPYLGMTWCVNTDGVFPTSGG